MTCLGVVLFGFNLFGTLCAFWTCIIYFLCQIGKFSFIIFSNKFSVSCSSSSPSGTPMIWTLEHWKLSQRFLSLFSFLWIPVSSLCSGWMFISSFYSKWLIWVPVSFPLQLIPCIYSFISRCIAFTSSFILWPYSTISVGILITSVLNSSSDRLAISLCWGLFLDFWSVLSFGLYFFCLGAPVT